MGDLKKAIPVYRTKIGEDAVMRFRPASKPFVRKGNYEQYSGTYKPNIQISFKAPPMMHNTKTVPPPTLCISYETIMPNR